MDFFSIPEKFPNNSVNEFLLYFQHIFCSKILHLRLKSHSLLCKYLSRTRWKIFPNAGSSREVLSVCPSVCHLYLPSHTRPEKSRVFTCVNLVHKKGGVILWDLVIEIRLKNINNIPFLEMQQFYTILLLQY